MEVLFRTSQPYPSTIYSLLQGFGLIKKYLSVAYEHPAAFCIFCA